VGLGEQAKLRRVDKVLKAVATVLLLYVLVFV
jgi:hypothetical protein